MILGRCRTLIADAPTVVRQRDLHDTAAAMRNDRDIRVVLFTDLVDSVGLTKKLRDRSLAVVKQHDAVVRKVLADLEGFETKSLGDGIMCFFYSASAAVNAGLRIRKTLSELGIAVRVGVDVGEPQVSDGDLFGHTVQRAARICHEAASESVWVSSLVKGLCDGGPLRFVSTGAYNLKGFIDFETLFQAEEQPTDTALMKDRWRKWVEEILPGRMASEPSALGTVIIFLDIDGQTLINKRFGVALGDQVLASVARVLVRDEQVTASGRCGDDTFFALIGDPGLTPVPVIVETIRLAVVDPGLWKDLLDDWRFSVTVGYSVYQKGRESPEAWIERAALGMTLAKQKGQNDVGEIEGAERMSRGSTAATETTAPWSESPKSAPSHPGVRLSRWFS